MATEEKVPQKEFATAKTSVVIKPKTKNELVMIYRGLQDLKSLILFVGSRPVLNADASIQYKKFIITPAKKPVFNFVAASTHCAIALPRIYSKQVLI